MSTMFMVAFVSQAAGVGACRSESRGVSVHGAVVAVNPVAGLSGTGAPGLYMYMTLYPVDTCTGY